MQLQNCQVIGVRSQRHFEGTNNNKVVRASGRPMALFVFSATGCSLVPGANQMEQCGLFSIY